MQTLRQIRVPALVALALLAYVAAVPAQLNTKANIAATKHNLSASGPGTTKATAEDQICVFCHTPHAANATAPAPLWNRKLGGGTNDANTYAATYSPYQSNSLNAAEAVADLNGIKTLPPPGGTSKLCLSCHDGTLALGTVGVLDGKENPSAVAGLTGTMPEGLGKTTGFTRNLGVDLRNDHPISFTFDTTLASADGELRQPPYSAGGRTVVGPRSSDAKPMLPLDHEGKVQCTSCHDPHLEASRFLRLNRLQKVAPAGGDFIADNDQICLGCHNKLGTSWSNSAHANPLVADETYTPEAAATNRRDFLVNGSPAKVWEAACLNCHDTHSVQGSRRLLREGVSGSGTGADSSFYKAGSTASDPATSSEIAETCYQCHQGDATKVITGAVPDIKTQFTTKTRRMPITTDTQGYKKGTTPTYSSTERHNIGNADFIENPEQLGAGNHDNRHAECTDCHNPHRVIRNSLFNGEPGDANSTRRTHVAGGTAGLLGADGNIASGVLRGTWGVEPTYGAVTTWPQAPSYTVKYGDPGASKGTDRIQPYLTREYQLCLKCHSDYGGTAGGLMPWLGYTGGTSAGTMGLNRYTNVAAEFAVSATDPPSAAGKDQGETGNDSTFTPEATNHRSWHPVLMPTGRTSTERTGGSTTFTNIRAPFNTKANIGYQTMHCSDCHGGDATGLNEPTVQGPHGSNNNFLLKGIWSNAVKPGGIDSSNSNNYLCGRCHNPANTAGGFRNGDASHSFSSKQNSSCTSCHIAIPHGWKNKAFLVNLACVQREGGAGYSDSCTNVSGSSRVTIEPYYYRAILRIKTWQRSNAWTMGSCGSGSDSEDWMSSTCENGGS
ncbi:multiheme c-type cytochrome [Aromatoleum sp.]|uniref:multiheme c-type cytochrome n=1 Tax=Aromatoleum sp. TaxID=2307007 RepID=UPI002FC6BB2B